MNEYTIIFSLFIFQTHCRFIQEDYMTARNSIIDEEDQLSLGGKITLSDDEKAANEIIMKYKLREIDEEFVEPEKEDMWERAEKSQVCEIIRKMPKGAALHVHSSYMLDVDSLIGLTYGHDDHLYACYHDDLKLHFSESIPTLPCPVNWELLSVLRAESGDQRTFDTKLRKHFSFIPIEKDESINEAWERFEKVHKVIKSLITYRPVREMFFLKSLENFYDDNVKYLEIRSGLNTLYELNGTVHERMYMARLYKNITERFIESHPDFMGFKIILTAYRAVSNEKISQALDLARNLKNEMPEYFAGFDLVGQEDLGRPLLDFIPELIAANDIDFYFHAGETNWFGTSTDENLIDAVLLGSKRIGHGYALLKHPGLLKIVKERNIPIEINVVSNRVLSLVTDERNHPLATYLALDMPVILSSDDPGAFGTEPLSHDFYLAFISVGSRRYDLRMLKALALNSIRYSALNNAGKDKLNRIFEDDWDGFIKDIISNQNFDKR